MTTLKEIAKECSVSIATVSNIINNKSNVSEETKQRILKVIQEKEYKPNYMARGLRASKSFIIGVLIDDLTAFSSPAIVDGIMSYLEEKNYKTIIENLRFYSKWGKNLDTSDDYKNAVASAIQELNSVKVDGIIYVASHARNIDCISGNSSVPVTICYGFSKEHDFPSVMINDELASYNLTNYLIKKGNTQLAIIAGNIENIHTEKRLAGLQKALSEAGTAFNQKALQYSDWTFEGGYSACKKLYESGEKFSAIFCFNDVMAAGVYKYLREIKVMPGKDISVTGFDNRFDEELLEPKLTTMKIPLSEIGQKSAELILNQIENKNTEAQEIYIDCPLVEGESVKQIL